MADIDAVLERLVTDAGFRAQLGSDPAAALSGYDLSTEDLQLLAGSLDDGDTAQRGVETRTSKSAVIGLLASLTGGGGGGGGAKLGKDSAGYDELAAPRGASSEELHKLPGKPKPGEIILTRSATAPPAGDWDGDGVEQAAGGKKGYDYYQAQNSGKDLAAPVEGTDEASLEFKQGYPVKWESAGLDEGSSAPVDPVAPDEFHHEKWRPPAAADRLAPHGQPDPSPAEFDWKTSSAGAERLAPPSAPGTSDEALDFKHSGASDASAGKGAGDERLNISPMKAGDTTGLVNGDAPPLDKTGPVGSFPKKLEFGQMKAGDTSRLVDDDSPASLIGLLAPTGDDQVQGNLSPATEAAHEDFLTIEDE